MTSKIKLCNIAISSGIIIALAVVVAVGGRMLIHHWEKSALTKKMFEYSEYNSIIGVIEDGADLERSECKHS